jgi:hypothetical protein
LHHCNIDSSIIEVKRTFRYKGNTKRTKRMRGHTADAAPALKKCPQSNIMDL